MNQYLDMLRAQAERDLKDAISVPFYNETTHTFCAQCGHGPMDKKNCKMGCPECGAPST